MYETLMKAIEEYQGDIASCKIDKFEEGGQTASVKYSGNVQILDNIQAMHALIEDSVIQQVVWNKIYHRKVLKDILFEVGKHHEDEFWSYQVFGRAQKVVLVDHLGYHYLQRKDSIMGEQYSVHRLDAVEAKVQRQKYLEQYYPGLVAEGKINLLFTCLYQGQMAIKNLRGEEKKRIIGFLSEVIKSNILTIKEEKELSLSHRVWIIMSQKAFEFTCVLRNSLKVGM